MVEGERHAVVAEPGDHRESVLQPVAPEAVRAVTEPKRHVGDTTLAAAFATGPMVTSTPAVATAPVRAVNAACSGIKPRTPAPVACRTVGPSGRSAAAACARPTVTA